MIFCIIFFFVLSTGHLLGMVVKGSMESRELREQLYSDDLDPVMRHQLESNLANISKIDFWSVLSGFGNILFGLDLPLPFMVLVTIVNGILLLVIALLIWSFIKAMVPFISG